MTKIKLCSRVTHYLGRRAYLLLAVAAICLGSRPVSALPQFVDVAKSTYSFKAGGVIAGSSCTLCHVSAGPPKLNPYGTDVKGALKAANTQTLSSAILHSLDAKDSDGDGFTNKAEFAADTLPGDPASKPTGTPDAGAKPAEVAPSGSASSGSGEPNPFDIKAAIFAKHAQHPILVHFPIGLFVMSVIFEILGLRGANLPLRKAAYYNLIAAAITAVLSLITGLICWKWQFGGETLKGNILLHLIFAIVTTVLMFVMWGIRSKMAKAETPGLIRIYIVIALIALAAISLTGHIGGILSGVAGG